MRKFDIIRLINNAVNDMTALLSGLINDLDKVMKTMIVKVYICHIYIICQSLFG